MSNTKFTIQNTESMVATSDQADSFAHATCFDVSEVCPEMETLTLEAQENGDLVDFDMIEE